MPTVDLSDAEWQQTIMILAQSVPLIQKIMTQLNEQQQQPRVVPRSTNGDVAKTNSKGNMEPA
jgi:hypothetical protein